MSDWVNAFKLMVSSKRWMKKYFRPLMPQEAWVQVEPNLRMFFSVRDISGPSFDLAYDQRKAFYNYELTDKKLIEMYINDQSTFLDVGSNIGHFSFYFKSLFPNLNCHLFEPIPWLADCVRHTLRDSQLNNVHLHQMALSDQNGESTFYIDTFNDGGHSLLAEKLSGRSQQGRSIKVNVRKLDDMIGNELKLTRLDFIKVDVQGAERSFLKGAKDTIRTFKPKMLIEVAGEDSIRFAKDMQEILEMRFKIHSHRREGPLTEADLAELIKAYREQGIQDCNYLFLPE